MKKILQISASNIGGGFRVMEDIIKGLKKDFDFIIIIPENKISDRDKKTVNSKTRRIKEGNIFSIINQIRKIILTEKPGIINAHGTRAAFWARLAVLGIKKKPKIIYILHGFHIIRKNFLFRWALILVERILNQWTNILVCVSEEDKRLVLGYKIIPENKIRLIRNGINVDNFRVDKERAKKEKIKLGLSDKFVLTSISRLHPQKDFSTLLKALKILINQLPSPNIKLLIVGDGPLKDTLENLTEKLSLEDYVDFLGFREDIPVLINISDIIILSTNWEGLPLVPLEAGASRKTIVASDVAGVRETILDKKTGFLFEPNSAGDLAKKILKLYHSKKLLEKIGEKGYENVSKNFNKLNMLTAYKTLYNELL